MTNINCYVILAERSAGTEFYGGIAQLARASGSYPAGRWFKSDFRYHIRPVGQAVKTPPFHGSNGGSIPPRVTKTKILSTFVDGIFVLYYTLFIIHHSFKRIFVMNNGYTRVSPVYSLIFIQRLKILLLFRSRCNGILFLPRYRA